MKLGKEIGRGKWRIVYTHTEDTTLVIKKLEPDITKFDVTGVKRVEEGYNPNLQEWLLWLKYKDTDTGQILCPCISISEDHKFLVMKKASKAVSKTQLRVSLAPSEIGDITALHNWGIIDDLCVIIDYGNIF